MHFRAQVDIWSFGCVLGEMALLTPLIPGEDTGDQIGEVKYSRGIIYCAFVSPPVPFFLIRVKYSLGGGQFTPYLFYAHSATKNQ